MVNQIKQTIEWQNIGGVIWDFDGVIADSDPFNRWAIGEMFEELGIDFDHEVFELYFTGRTLKDALGLVLTDHPRQTTVDELVAKKMSYDKEYPRHLIAYEDALRLYEWLHQEQKHLAIATGSRKILINMALSHLNITPPKVIVTSEDYQKGKPSPDAYLLAMEKLNLAAENLLVIEDHPRGIEAAQKAGIRVVGVSHKYEPSDLEQADLVVTSLIDLIG